MNKWFGVILMALTAVMCYLHLSDMNNNEITKKTSAVYDEKIIAITFDDGPGYNSTRRLLDGLKERNVVASFFVVGENAENNKELIKRMYNEGHLICNHTYTHIDLSKIDKKEALEEITRTNALIESITGEKPSYIRPPGGAWDEKMFFEVDMTPVFWTVDPCDWKRTDVEGIVNDVVNSVSDGSIILLHDIYDTSVAAALEIIDRLKDKGYLFVTVDEILIS